jgi:hypothetical protein
LGNDDVIWFVYLDIPAKYIHNCQVGNTHHSRPDWVVQFAWIRRALRQRAYRIFHRGVVEFVIGTRHRVFDL